MPSPRAATRILLRSGHSDGELSVIDLPVGADFGGPPLHHHAFDEAFYVLDGEMTFQLSDELRTAGAGEEPPTWAAEPPPKTHIVGPRIGERDDV